MLDEATTVRDDPLEAIICSGMITSNMGLLEVAHLPAPARPDDLARNVVQREFSGVSELSLSFIPGVKILPSVPELDDLAAGDVLRGEETEIVGLRSRLHLVQDCVFLHIGSHHKAIDVHADGAILGSRSAITGELLSAVASNTILKGSTVDLGELKLDINAALAGARSAQRHGLGRAM